MCDASQAAFSLLTIQLSHFYPICLLTKSQIAIMLTDFAKVVPQGVTLVPREDEIIKTFRHFQLM